MAPRDSATSKQMLVKGRLLHKEFGTRAGFPFLSQYRIQRGNAISSTMLIASNDAVVADRIEVSSALTILQYVNCGVRGSSQLQFAYART
jgi:hypothetical protein